MGMNAMHLANSILLATMQLKFSQAYQAQTSKEMWRRRQLVVQKLLSDAMTENITLPSFRNPVFLQEKWGELSEKKQNKCKMNYLPLDVRLDHQVAPTAVQAYFELHPAILMGLRYSLRWFWMGCCEHEEMSPMDAREQEQQKVGWKGPDTWPVVLGNRFTPFNHCGWLMATYKCMQLQKHGESCFRVWWLVQIGLENIEMILYASSLIQESM